jgi:hypothetical protein
LTREEFTGEIEAVTAGLFTLDVDATEDVVVAVGFCATDGCGIPWPAI